MIPQNPTPCRDARGAGLGVLRKLTPLAGIVTFLLVWQVFVVAYGVPAYLLPAPAGHRDAFVSQLPSLLSNGWVTVYEMLAGYALAVGIAIPLAIAITSSQAFQRIRDADHAVLSDRAEGRDRAVVPGVVRRRSDAQSPGRIPDLVLSRS